MLNAAMAAAAASNRSLDKDVTNSKLNENMPPKKFETDMATEKSASIKANAKLEHRTDKEEPKEYCLSAQEDMSISACAVASDNNPCVKKLKKPRRKVSTDQDGAPMGIAAMAAAAARKRNAQT